MGNGTVGSYYSWVFRVLLGRSLRRTFGARCRIGVVAATCLATSVATLGAQTPTPSIFPLGSEWVSMLPAPPALAPTTDGSYLYVPLRNGLLAAVFVGDGVLQWIVEQNSDFPPTVGGQSLFVAEGSQVRALWAASGTERWRLDLHAPVSSPVLWDAGWLIVGLENGDLLAYDGRDGRPLWSQRLAATALSPTIDGDRLFAPQADGHVSALELMTGDLVWERQLGGTPEPIAAFGDRVYLGTTDNFLYAIDRLDGRIRWRWRTGGDVVGAPVVTDEAIYFVSLDNQLRALAQRTGVQLWKRDLPTRPVGGPIHLAHVLMMPGRTPTLYTFYLGTGGPAGQIGGSTELAAPPIVIRGEQVDDVEFVLLTGEGELQAYASAEPFPLDVLAYLPGANQADGALAVPGARGPLETTPGHRFVPPLIPGLPTLPGHAGPARLVPLDALPGRSLDLEGVVRPPTPY